MVNAQSPTQESKQEQKKAELSLIAAHFSGPLPHPDILIKYEEASKGAANRIITLAEEQAKHRQLMERKVIDSNITNERIGMIFAFILVLSLITFGGFLIYTGKNIPAGYFTLFTPLLYLGVSFFDKKHRERKEQEDKEKEIEEQERKT